MAKITIDMGKGVVLNAPIKMNMNLDEWQRMTAYIDNVLKAQRVAQPIRIIQK